MNAASSCCKICSAGLFLPAFQHQQSLFRLLLDDTQLKDFSALLELFPLFLETGIVDR